MKYSGKHLTKFVQDLQNDNYKTLLREIKEYLHKKRSISYSWIAWLHIVKMSVLPQNSCIDSVLSQSKCQ